MREHAAVKAAVSGRESEFRGIAIVVAGVVAALGVYLDVAGPVGDGIDTALGWILGLGRFLLPPALVAIGVVAIRRNESEHRLRVAVGGVIVVVATLGLLHLARGGGHMTAKVDALAPAGGWIGAVIAQPLRTLLSIVGAVVVLLAVLLGGVLIVTGMSLPVLVQKLRANFSTVAVPTARAAKKLINEIQTSGDWGGDKAERDVQFFDQSAPPVPEPQIETLDDDRPVDNSHVPAFDPGAPRPTLYDFALEDQPAAKPARARRKATPEPGADNNSGAEFPPRPARKDTVTTPDGEELALGPAARRGTWTLPAANMLAVSPTQAVDRAAVEARGELLETSLASHGVDTRLVGMTVGPTNRKSTRLNSSHVSESRMPSSA